MLHNLVNFLQKILNLNQHHSLNEHKMTTNVVLWQSTINELSNDIQHNINILYLMKILVIECEYVYLHFDKICGFGSLIYMYLRSWDFLIIADRHLLDPHAMVSHKTLVGIKP